MKFERHLVSKKPPAEVLRLIADFRHLKSWDDSVISVEPLDPVFGEGSRYRVKVRFSGNVIEMEYTVTAYEAGERAVLTGVAPKATAIDVIEVEPSEAGTNVRYIAEIQLAFPYNLLDRWLARGFAKTVDHAVAGLTRFLSS